MSSGEPTWYTYTIGGGDVSSGGSWTTNTGNQIMWGGTGGYWQPVAPQPKRHEFTEADFEEMKKQFDFDKLGIPFKSQAELTKEKLEKIREAMAKYVVVVEIDSVPTAVIPADKISDLYNAIKEIVEK